MSEESVNGHTEHPEAALAAYADGTASPEELRSVEAHLKGCESCKRELDLSRAAILSLGSLQERDAPDLSMPRSAGPVAQVTAIHAGRRPGVRRRVAWASAGIAAAAAAAAVVTLFVASGGGLRGSTSAPAGNQERPVVHAAAAPSFVARTRVNYTPAALETLAASVAQKEMYRSAASSPTPVGQFTSNKNPGASSPVRGPSAASIVECVHRAAGSPPAATIQRVEIARYLGKRSYVGVMTVSSGADRRILAVAANPFTCDAFHISVYRPG